MQVRRLTVLLLAMLICGPAMAGRLTCLVTRGGAPVSGATVALAPGGATADTNAEGVCEFRGLAAGDYEVRASKTIGGALYGAIEDGVRVPGRRDSSVTLEMTRAILVHGYVPLARGSTWQYEVTRTAAGGTSTSTRNERVEGTTRMAGTTVTVLGVTSRPAGDTMRMFMNSSAKHGWAYYGEERATDTLSYDPPLQMGDLCPEGYEWELTSRLSHTDGTPAQPVTLRCKLAGFDTVTVPAGTFRDCARVEMFFDVGGATDKQTVWLAERVGQVRVVEKNEERRSERVLEEYRIGGLLRRVLPVAPLAP